jgi:hypothetical protein
MGVWGQGSGHLLGWDTGWGCVTRAWERRGAARQVDMWGSVLKRTGLWCNPKGGVCTMTFVLSRKRERKQKIITNARKPLTEGLERTIKRHMQQMRIEGRTKSQTIRR